MRRTLRILPGLFVLLCALVPPSRLIAQQDPAGSAAPAGEPLHVSRATGPIEVDGSLGDPGWNGATRVETFYETNPGDNVEPKVKTVAWLTYDDRFFYAAFDFSDPDPKGIRAPFGDHDDISSSTFCWATSYARNTCVGQRPRAHRIQKNVRGGRACAVRSRA